MLARAAQATTTIRLVGPATTVGVADVFDVRVEVETDTALDGAAAFLDFDPAVLEALEIVPGGVLPTEIRRRIDNAAGTVDFAAGSFGNRPSGTFLLATLRLRARNTSAGTTISFSTTQPRGSGATTLGAAVPTDLVPLTFAISAMSSPVEVAVVPTTTTVRIGRTFDVVVEVRSGAKQVDGAAAFLDFDPSALQVVSISGGTALPQPLLNRFDNVAGQLDFAAGNLNTLPSGTFTLASVRFRAVGVASSSPLAWSSAAPRETAVTVLGRALALQLSAGAVTVLDAEPIVTLAVVPSVSSLVAGESFDVAVEVRAGTQEVDGAAAFLNFDPALFEAVSVTRGANLGTIIRNERGEAGRIDFAAGDFSSLPVGTFTLATVRFRTLAAAPAAQISFSTQQPRGSDATYAGRSVLAATLGASVEILAAEPGVRLVVVPPAGSVSVGNDFDVAVQVRAGAQRVDGAAAFLEFDPALMQALSITPGTALTSTIATEIDNNSGRVRLAYGEFGTPPSGTFTVATVRFHAVAANPAATIVPGNTPPQRSDVTWGGASVMTAAVGATFAIQPAGVVLALVGPPSFVRPGDEFSVMVEARAGAAQVDGVAAFVDFDRNVLDVVSVQPGSLLTSNIQNQTDAAHGRVNFAAGTFSNFPTGTFSVATIRFRARVAAAGGTRIGFSRTAPRLSDVTLGGVSILSAVEAATVTIRGGDVELGLLPGSVSVAYLRRFDIDVEVRTGTQAIDGVSIALDFDRDKLEVAEIVPGSLLDTNIQGPVVDNPGGRVDFAYGQFATLPQGTLRLATIRFRARGVTTLDPEPTTQIRFSTTAPRLTDVTYGGKSVLGTFGAATVQIAPRCALDVDESGAPAEGDTDVRYIRRHLFDLPAAPAEVRAGQPSLLDDATIAVNVDELGPHLDVDADGRVDAATDLVYAYNALAGRTPVPASFRAGQPGIVDDEAIADAVRELCCLPEQGCTPQGGGGGALYYCESGVCPTVTPTVVPGGGAGGSGGGGCAIAAPAGGWSGWWLGVLVVLLGRGSRKGKTLEPRRARRVGQAGRWQRVIQSFFLLFVSFVVQFPSSSAQAQQAIYPVDVTTTAGATGVRMPIHLQNDEPLTLLVFELRFDPALCALLTNTSLVQAGRALAAPETDAVRCPAEGRIIGVIGPLDGAVAIPLGDGAIAEWVFDVAPELAPGVYPISFVVVQSSDGPVASSLAASGGDLVVSVPSTPTESATGTPTSTDTPSDTPTATATGTASATATRTPEASPTPTVFLSGNLLHYANANPVANALVDGRASAGGPVVLSVVSGSDGAYAMIGAAGGAWVVEPHLTDTRTSILRGVSTLDATHVQEYAVGLRTFTGNQRLAGDSTGNGAVSSLDATRIQEWRSGIRTRLPVADNCGSDWVFVPVPGPQGDPAPVAPLMGPGTACRMGRIEYSTLTGSASGQNFQAVLMGDVTGNWTPPAGVGPATALEAMEWGADGIEAGAAMASLPVPPACDGPCVVAVPSGGDPAGCGGTKVLLAVNHLEGVQAFDLEVEVPSGLKVLSVKKAELAAAPGDCSLVWNAGIGSLRISLACLAPIDGGGALLDVAVQGCAAGEGFALSKCSFDEGANLCPGESPGLPSGVQDPR